MDLMPPTALPREAVLRGALLATRDMLGRRRAAEIPEGYIDGYLGLKWMEWQGGALRLTTVGENICRRLLAQQRLQ